MGTMNLKPCLAFSQMLSYPNERIKLTAADFERQLKEFDPAAAAAFLGYLNFLELQDLPQIEELFTSTFDLQALSDPYVGYQLCGESQARTLFLIKLQELYAKQDFSCGTELPDHLSVMLRFIGSIDDPQGNTEIIVDALLPALEKIITGFETQDHPYRHLLNALQIYLTNTVETELPETKRQKELSHG
jgi:nitrate reductase delta subunit